MLEHSCSVANHAITNEHHSKQLEDELLLKWSSKTYSINFPHKTKYNGSKTNDFGHSFILAYIRIFFINGSLAENWKPQKHL